MVLVDVVLDEMVDGVVDGVLVDEAPAEGVLDGVLDGVLVAAVDRLRVGSGYGRHFRADPGPPWLGWQGLTHHYYDLVVSVGVVLVDTVLDVALVDGMAVDGVLGGMLANGVLVDGVLDGVLVVAVDPPTWRVSG